MSEVYDLYQEGLARLRAGLAAQATVPLERARRAEPDKASIREALGRAYLTLRRYEEAEQEFSAMLELAPNDHYAYYCLGRCQEGTGRMLLAQGSYKMASWLLPGNGDYERALTRVMRRTA
jgi:Flp pilus assembly protein TadD